MNLFSLLFREPILFFLIVATFVIVLSVHEYSHALAGSWLGDPTAERMKRLTLNPLAHIDPVGFLMLLVVGFGWGKPVPFNPYNLRYQRWGPALVAAAGPVSNFLMGMVAVLALRALSPSLGDQNLLVIFLTYAAYLNFLLGFFNLIPIPPLDGSKALLSALANERYRATRFLLETRGPLLLIGLILVDSIFGLGIFSGLSHLAQAIVGAVVGR